MSRSQKTVENPAERFFDWDAKNGNIKYWDKQQQKEIAVDLPFHFLMLDTLTTIRGFHNKSDSGIWSNEVRSLDHLLKVKAFEGGLIAEGTYDNIKDKVKAAGGKFAKSVYIAYNDNGQMRIGNINFKGASLGPWIDLVKQVGRRGLEEKAVVITGSRDESNGDIQYKVPVMKVRDPKPESDQKAIALDEQLQEYLEKKVDAVEVPESEVKESADGDIHYGDSQSPPMPEEPVGADSLYNENDALPF